MGLNIAYLSSEPSTAGKKAFGARGAAVKDGGWGWGGAGVRGERIWGIWSDQRKEVALGFSKWISLTSGTPKSWGGQGTRGSHDNVPPEAHPSGSKPQPRTWLNCFPTNLWATSEHFIFWSLRFRECTRRFHSRPQPGGCELEPDYARPPNGPAPV